MSLRGPDLTAVVRPPPEPSGYGTSRRLCPLSELRDGLRSPWSLHIRARPGLARSCRTDPALCCPLGAPGAAGRPGQGFSSCDLLRTQTLTQESLRSWQLQVAALGEERLIAPPEPKSQAK
uniref:Uncharacterized protein n=1 Tax=Rangifer tarandus platyrhynchus TaxID=3082113 RepID=A0ACB0EEP4_RANTA|nr:unnamed protein product [Rangifer tarandus platyrhynchus]